MVMMKMMMYNENNVDDYDNDDDVISNGQGAFHVLRPKIISMHLAFFCVWHGNMFILWST